LLKINVLKSIVKVLRGNWIKVSKVLSLFFNVINDSKKKKAGQSKKKFELSRWVNLEGLPARTTEVIQSGREPPTQ